MMSSQEEKESSDWPEICNCEVEVDTMELSDYTDTDQFCTAKLQLEECKMSLIEKDAKIISLKSDLEVRFCCLDKSNRVSQRLYCYIPLKVFEIFSLDTVSSI